LSILYCSQMPPRTAPERKRKRKEERERDRRATTARLPRFACFHRNVLTGFYLTTWGAYIHVGRFHALGHLFNASQIILKYMKSAMKTIGFRVNEQLVWDLWRFWNHVLECRSFVSLENKNFFIIDNTFISITIIIIIIDSFHVKAPTAKVDIRKSNKAIILASMLEWYVVRCWI
jgi:hypothetical protein